jgi:hypothetical protein
MVDDGVAVVIAHMWAHERALLLAEAQSGLELRQDSPAAHSAVQSVKAAVLASSNATMRAPGVALSQQEQLDREVQEKDEPQAVRHESRARRRHSPRPGREHTDGDRPHRDGHARRHGSGGRDELSAEFGVSGFAAGLVPNRAPMFVPPLPSASAPAAPEVLGIPPPPSPPPPPPPASPSNVELPRTDELAADASVHLELSPPAEPRDATSLSAPAASVPFPEPQQLKEMLPAEEFVPSAETQLTAELPLAATELHAPSVAYPLPLKGPLGDTVVACRVMYLKVCMYVCVCACVCM